MKFRRLSYTLLGFGLLLLAKLGFANTKGVNNAIVLESNDSIPDTHYHGSHSSHCSHSSHASHFSSHFVNNTDSIQSLSSENFISLKKLLRDNQDIDVYRSFIAEAIITSLHNKTDDTKSSKTLVIIGRDLSCDSNIWIYVTLTQTPMTYSWSSNGVNRIRSNKISELYRNCPPSAHQYSLSDEILSFINSSIKPIIQ